MQRLTSDPLYNATLGAHHLGELLDRLDRSYVLTFVGYNAGPGRARQWVAAYGDPRGGASTGRLDRAHSLRRDPELRPEGHGKPADLPLTDRVSPVIVSGSRPWRTAGLSRAGDLFQAFRLDCLQPSGAGAGIRGVSSGSGPRTGSAWPRASSTPVRRAACPSSACPGCRATRATSSASASTSRHPTEPRSVFALDYRGRGLSDPDPDWRNYTPLVEARDVLAAATALGIERAIVVGTSRGGIIAMLLGALRPTLLAGVVLNDIGPVIEGTGLARIKKYLTARRSSATGTRP